MVSQREIAELLECSVATVSRLRAGLRQPSFLLMERIEEALGWKIEDQSRARSKQRWHLDFETKLRQRETDPSPVASPTV